MIWKSSECCLQLGLQVFALLMLTSQSCGKVLSRKERKILDNDLGSRASMFVGRIPDIEDVGVFHPVQIPTKFSAYDVNPKDGFITLIELTTASEAEEGAKTVFREADVNHDGKISILEFMRAPWKLRPNSNYVVNSEDLKTPKQ